MSAHTPGPWRVSGGRYIKQSFTDVGLSNDAGAIIATTPGGRTSGPFFIEDDAEVSANARLIAAAPELLATLKRYVDHFGDPLQCANAAIAQAEGQP